MKQSRNKLDLNFAEQFEQVSINRSHIVTKKTAIAPRVTLRLTEKELIRLKSMAEGTSMSAYIRSCVFGENATKRKRRSHIPVQDQQSLARALALLGQSRIANNLNQLAHHANTGSLIVDDAVEQQIEEAYQHINSMRRELIRAIGLFENR